MTYSITTRKTQKGVAFDLYFRWKGQRYRPLLGYNLTKEKAEEAAIAKIQLNEQQVAPLHLSPISQTFSRCIGKPCTSRSGSTLPGLHP
ncbi:MAG: hypothetical protein CV089_20490 [Nitrospira sp. WS110]|nr:hypothetical protein [Nitrospira sp. WS110]